MTFEIVRLLCRARRRARSSPFLEGHQPLLAATPVFLFRLCQFGRQDRRCRRAAPYGGVDVLGKRRHALSIRAKSWASSTSRRALARRRHRAAAFCLCSSAISPKKVPSASFHHACASAAAISTSPAVMKYIDEAASPRRNQDLAPARMVRARSSRIDVGDLRGRQAARTAAPAPASPCVTDEIAPLHLLGKAVEMIATCAIMREAV